MHSYLAFAWPAQREDACAQAAVWRESLAASAYWSPAWQVPGLEVWTARGQRMPVRPLGGAGAVVIGDGFDRAGSGDPQPAHLPDLPEDPVAAARACAAEAWGAYVAVLPDPAGGAPWAFREPAAMLEALTWRRGEVVAISDDVVCLPRGLAPADLALDWDVITEIVRRPMAAAHLSPLAGFAVIAPGDAQPLGAPGAAAVGIWRPSAWANTASEAEESALRETVYRTVSGFASVEPRLLVEVSGGLDSAIVATALVETGHRHRIAAALNYHGVRREGDERVWAQAVCDRLGLPLVSVAKAVGEIAADDADDLVGCAAPAFMGLDAPRDRDAALRVEMFGATATFGGQGGDAVFYQMPTALVVADYLRAHGRQAWRDPFVADVARWLRRPVWSVLGQARRRRDPVAGQPPESAPFWGPRARAPTGAAAHPWLAELPSLSPAKQVQVEAILGIQAAWRRSRRGRAGRIVHPLLAQPMLELALSIPAWRLVRGGQDRAFARAAFADVLPPAVAARQSKGALTSDYTKRVAASLPFLRQHLVGGVLAQAGVLDGAAMDAALDPDQLIWNGAGARLTQAALVESWVRHWQARVPDRPAAPRGRP